MVPYEIVSKAGSNGGFAEYSTFITGTVGQSFTQHIAGKYGLAFYNMTDDFKKAAGEDVEVYITATPAIAHDNFDFVYMDVKAEWKDKQGMYHQASQMVDFTNFELFKNNKLVGLGEISKAIRNSKSTFIKRMGARQIPC